MLRARVLSAIVAVPVVALIVYLGGLPWLAGILLVGVLAWFEMNRLLGRPPFAADRLLALAFILAALLEPYLRLTGVLRLDPFRLLVAGLLILSLIIALYDRGENPSQLWAMNVASTLYLGFLLSHFIALRLLPDGLRWTLAALVLTWTDDVFAYFVGSATGKHKMLPRISPKKSWEGWIGGTLACLIAGPLVGQWLLPIGPGSGLLLAVLVALVAPFGDFAVSLFKRAAHVKDSGQLIPGHGGALDRLDSLLFTFPVVTYFAMFIMGG